MQRSSVTWDEVVKKEARGLDDFHLGEVQAVGGDYIVTEKGTVSRHKYFLPKSLVRGYDGKYLRFNISERQADSEFKRDNQPAMGEYDRYRTTPTTPTTTTGMSDTVPMI